MFACGASVGISAVGDGSIVLRVGAAGVIRLSSTVSSEPQLSRSNDRSRSQVSVRIFVKITCL